MKLRRKVGETSLIVTSVLVVAFLLVACWFGTQQAADRVLQREAEIAARGWATLLRGTFPDLRQIFATGHLGKDDARILRSVAATGRVARYRLFGADGKVIPDPGIPEPDLNLDPAQFDMKIKKGKIVVDLKHDGSGRDNNRLLSRSYVPVIENGAFLGAIASITDMTDRAAELRHQRIVAFVTLFLSLTVAGAALGIAIRRRFEGNAQIRASLENRTKELARSQERLRIALENVDSANRAKAQFLANMSHELRTPLNAIIGFSEAISFELFGPVNNVKYRDYADDISSSGQHLLQLVTDILDFSKVEAGNLQLNEKVVSLPGLISSVRSHIQPLAETADVRIVADLPPMDLHIHGDELRLRQILINLIGNAIRFSPRASQVEIRTEQCAEGSLEIRISDNGPGISADDLKKVMEPFHQIGDLMTRTRGGTGLGVPIARALAELHGGDLRYESNLGVGTTAILHLPEERLLRLEATSALA